MLCVLICLVNFILDLQDLQFKQYSKRQIFEKLFMQLYLLSELLPEICWKKVPKKYIFLVFRFVRDVSSGVFTMAVRLINEHTKY